MASPAASEVIIAPEAICRSEDAPATLISTASRAASALTVMLCALLRDNEPILLEAVSVPILFGPVSEVEPAPPRVSVPTVSVPFPLKRAPLST